LTERYVENYFFFDKIKINILEIENYDFNIGIICSLDVVYTDTFDNSIVEETIERVIQMKRINNEWKVTRIFFEK
jgi:hypothetical protein